MILYYLCFLAAQRDIDCAVGAIHRHRALVVAVGPADVHVARPARAEVAAGCGNNRRLHIAILGVVLKARPGDHNIAIVRVGADPDLVVEVGCATAISHQYRRAPGQAAVFRDIHKNGARLVHAVEGDIGIVDGVVGAKGDRRVADRGDLLEHPGRVRVGAEAGQLDILPAQAAIERGVDIAAVIVAQRAPRGHTALAVVVRAGHQIVRVVRAHGDRGLVLGRVAALVYAGPDMGLLLYETPTERKNTCSARARVLPRDAECSRSYLSAAATAATILPSATSRRAASM